MKYKIAKLEATMKTLIIILSIFTGVTLAEAYCQKSYVCDDEGNCGYPDVCDSTLDLPSVGLNPLPSLPSMELKPLPSMELPPLGTSKCEYQQVNGQWQNICH